MPIQTYETLFLLDPTKVSSDADGVKQQLHTLIERHGYMELMAWVLFGLALRHATEGDFDRFFDLAEQAVDAAREVGEPVSEGTAQAVMGGVELSLGRTERALERLEATRELLIEKGAGLPLPQTNIGIALARAALGDLEAARTGLEEAIATGADGGWALLWGTIELAELANVMGDSDRAEELARLTLEMTDRIGNRTRRGEANDSMIYYGLPGPYDDQVEDQVITTVQQVLKRVGRKPQRP